MDTELLEAIEKGNAQVSDLVARILELEKHEAKTFNRPGNGGGGEGRNFLSTSSRGYLIVDRIGVRVLQDPFSNKPYIAFYTTNREGGGVLNYECIKHVKIAVA
jgi:hypothetical protein